MLLTLAAVSAAVTMVVVTRLAWLLWRESANRGRVGVVLCLVN